MAIVFPADQLGTAIPLDGFSYKPKPAIERTEMESGFARARLVNRNPLRAVTVGYHWTSAQVEFFAAWLEYIAQYGAAWFQIDLPLEGTARTVLARFVNEYSRVPYRRTRWLVSVEFEVRDTNVITQDVMNTVIAYGIDGVPNMAAAIADLTLEPDFAAWAEFGSV